MKERNSFEEEIKLLTSHEVNFESILFESGRSNSGKDSADGGKYGGSPDLITCIKLKKIEKDNLKKQGKKDIYQPNARILRIYQGLPPHLKKNVDLQVNEILKQETGFSSKLNTKDLRHWPYIRMWLRFRDCVVTSLVNRDPDLEKKYLPEPLKFIYEWKEKVKKEREEYQIALQHFKRNLQSPILNSELNKGLRISFLDGIKATVDGAIIFFQNFGGTVAQKVAPLAEAVMILGNLYMDQKKLIDEEYAKISEQNFQISFDSFYDSMIKTKDRLNSEWENNFKIAENRLLKAYKKIPKNKRNSLLLELEHATLQNTDYREYEAEMYCNWIQHSAEDATTVGEGMPRLEIHLDLFTSSAAKAPYDIKIDKNDKDLMYISSLTIRKIEVYSIVADRVANGFNSIFRSLKLTAKSKRMSNIFEWPVDKLLIVTVTQAIPIGRGGGSSKGPFKILAKYNVGGHDFVDYGKNDNIHLMHSLLDQGRLRDYLLSKFNISPIGLNEMTSRNFPI